MTNDMRRAEIQCQIDCALAAGKMWDRISDVAYAQKRVISGDYAGQCAIRAYSRAEKLGEQLDADEGGAPCADIST